MVALAALPASAGAAFPGANGKLAYDSGIDGDVEIYVVNPDGTGKTQLTQNSGYDAHPAWSPDGTKIAFACCSQGSAELWVMSATGANPVQLTEGDGFVDSAAWSPDGTKIAFNRMHCPCQTSPVAVDLWTVDADGTDETKILDGAILEPSWAPDGTKIAIGYALTAGVSGISEEWISTVAPDGNSLTPITGSSGCFDNGPDWSPNAAKIVFDREGLLVTVNRDGTGPSSGCPAQSPATGFSPVWSPDGTKIAFLAQDPNPDGNQIKVANADLSGAQAITQVAPNGVNPGPPRGLDWQPIPINSYPRPEGATTIHASLVPAYRPCEADAATLEHAPPLAYPSCAAPLMASGHLTFGTGNVNGHPPNSRGHVWLTMVGESPIDKNNGDQSDVTYDLLLTDVRKRTDLTDYTGTLGVRIAVQITDRDNTPSPTPIGAATGTEIDISFNAPCSATASPNVGGTCIASTTADALVPGTIKEAQRAVWELGKVRVLDGGADGDAATGPNTVLATQGVFVP